ncbi:hypothetical protein [Nocardioides sp. URHA0032]|uniref:hypothetical protein n=1 Tax=Nocardioides sp. URHA0032 TaxID=1380388 RepID=UPI00055EFC02|nr:hypothetical protein [Nocardioides sp. URHA0032]
MPTDEATPVELLRGSLDIVNWGPFRDDALRSLLSAMLDLIAEVDRTVEGTSASKHWDSDAVLESLSKRLEMGETPDDPDPSHSVDAALDALTTRLANLIRSMTGGWGGPPTDDVDAVDVAKLEKLLNSGWDLRNSAGFRAHLRALTATAAARAAEADLHARSADDARKSAEKAAGLAADATLAQQFKTEASNQNVAKWTYRILATGLFATSIAIAVRLSSTIEDEPRDTQWPYLVAHLLVTTAVLALGAYLARLGNQHAERSAWAKTIEMQLKTFEAFTAPIDDPPTRWRIHEEFARRVLGSPPAASASDETASAPSVAALAEVAALLRREP